MDLTGILRESGKSDLLYLSTFFFEETQGKTLVLRDNSIYEHNSISAINCMYSNSVKINHNNQGRIFAAD